MKCEYCGLDGHADHCPECGRGYSQVCESCHPPQQSEHPTPATMKASETLMEFPDIGVININRTEPLLRLGGVKYSASTFDWDAALKAMYANSGLAPIAYPLPPIKFGSVEPPDPDDSVDVYHPNGWPT